MSIQGPFTPIEDTIIDSTAARLLSPGGYAALIDFLRRWTFETRNGTLPARPIPFTWTQCKRLVGRNAWHTHRAELVRFGFLTSVGGRSGYYSWADGWRNYTPTLQEVERLERHEAAQAERREIATRTRASNSGHGPRPEKSAKVSRCEETPRPENSAKVSDATWPQNSAKVPWPENSATPLALKQCQDPDSSLQTPPPISPKLATDGTQHPPKEEEETLRSGEEEITRTIKHAVAVFGVEAGDFPDRVRQAVADHGLGAVKAALRSFKTEKAGAGRVYASLPARAAHLAAKATTTKPTARHPRLQALAEAGVPEEVLSCVTWAPELGPCGLWRTRSAGAHQGLDLACLKQARAMGCGDDFIHELDMILRAVPDSAPAGRSGGVRIDGGPEALGNIIPLAGVGR